MSAPRATAAPSYLGTATASRRRSRRASPTSAAVRRCGGISRITLWSRPHAQHEQARVGAAAHQRSGRSAVRLPGRAVLDELDADHQARPADVADPSILGGDRSEAAGSARRPAPRRSRPGSRRLIVSSTASAGGAGHRVAAIRAAVGAPAPALLELAPASRSPTAGRPLAIALATHDHVGHDAGVLERPHPAGPAVAASGPRRRSARCRARSQRPRRRLQEGGRAPGSSRLRPGRARSGSTAIVDGAITVRTSPQGGQAASVAASSSPSKSR